MTWELFDAIWPFYLLLVVALLSTVGRVLAIRHAQQLDIHDRLRRSRQLRRDYLRSLRNRLNATAEVVDD